jgi:hypothetical protein
MKKTLALVLAALMTAGMTTVAFAAKAGDVNAMLGYAVNEGGDLVYATDVYYVLDSDDVAKLPEGANVEGGDEIAIPLVQWTDVNGDGNAITDADDTFEWYRDTDDLKKPNVYTDWRIGNADAEIRMVKYGAGDYRYSVVVTVPENDTNKPVDLEGKIMVGRTKNAAEDAIYGSFDLGVTYAPAAEVVKTYEGETLEAGKTGIYKFDSEDGEIDIEFGDQALFTVDVTGQGKLNLAWSTSFDSEIADKDKSANMDFITFKGEPSFNKNGTLYIYAADDTFLYQVVDGELKAVDADYDEDYEAWKLTTRTLGRYVISDKELDLDEINTVEDDKDNTSSTTDGGKENPDTGR